VQSHTKPKKKMAETNQQLWVISINPGLFWSIFQTSGLVWFPRKPLLSRIATSCGNIQNFKGKKKFVIGAPWQCKLCNIDPQEMGHFLPQVYLVITRTGSPLSIFGTIYLEPMKTQLEVGSLATLLKARESVQI
jgi:hypothetical protein